MRAICLSLLLVVFACSFANAKDLGPPAKLPEVPKGMQAATFAGGCFWCMEGPFEALDGVLSTTSGYTAGQKANPTYGEVSSGGTGHAEAIYVVFDPKKISYAKLLEVFWHNIDPLAKDRQFCDGGTQYRSGIYFHDPEQKKLAEQTKAEVAKKLGGTVHTEIAAATTFYPAEVGHQDFYKTNAAHYNAYRSGCGRDRRLKEIWGESVGH
jgi:peptide-methionine (S)-S-oxide reductase